MVQKGDIPWNKNKKCPQISKGLIGVIPWNKNKMHPAYEAYIEKVKRVNKERKGKYTSPFKGLNKENNEVIKKRSLTLKERYNTDPNIKCGFKKGSNPNQTKEWAEQTKNRMINKNPMKREEVRRKVSLTRKKNFELGITKRKVVSENEKQMLSKRMKDGQSIKMLLSIKRKDTKPELLLKKELEQRNIPFQYQKHIKTKFKHRFVDFFIEPNIIIEMDGNYFHHYPNGLMKDKFKDDLADQCGFITMRFWESEVYSSLPSIGDFIENHWRTLR